MGDNIKRKRKSEYMESVVFVKSQKTEHLKITNQIVCGSHAETD